MPMPNHAPSDLGLQITREVDLAADDDRLPIPQAALLITAMSLGLWVLIGYGVRLLLVG